MPLRDLTVVIPIWDDYMKYLPSALEMINAQGVGSTHTIVVDNASATPLPDDLPDDVQIVRLTERVSVGEARNAGLADVSTSLVNFFDADDQLVAGTLGQLCERLDAQPRAIVACFLPLTVQNLETGEEAIRDWPPPGRVELSRHRWRFAFWQSREPYVELVGAAVLRTDSARRCGGFSAHNFAEDWALGTTLSWRGRIVLERREGRIYRVHPDSLLWRRHTHAEIDAAYVDMVRHLRRYGPWFLRPVLPVFSWAYGRQARRMTADGEFEADPIVPSWRPRETASDSSDEMPSK